MCCCCLLFGIEWSAKRKIEIKVKSKYIYFFVFKWIFMVFILWTHVPNIKWKKINIFYIFWIYCYTIIHNITDKNSFSIIDICIIKFQLIYPIIFFCFFFVLKYESMIDKRKDKVQWIGCVIRAPLKQLFASIWEQKVLIWGNDINQQRRQFKTVEYYKRIKFGARLYLILNEKLLWTFIMNVNIEIIT